MLRIKASRRSPKEPWFDEGGHKDVGHPFPSPRSGAPPCRWGERGRGGARGPLRPQRIASRSRTSKIERNRYDSERFHNFYYIIEVYPLPLPRSVGQAGINVAANRRRCVALSRLASLIDVNKPKLDYIWIYRFSQLRVDEFANLLPRVSSLGWASFLSVACLLTALRKLYPAHCVLTSKIYSQQPPILLIYGSTNRGGSHGFSAARESPDLKYATGYQPVE